MGNLLNAAIKIGPVVLVIGLLVAVVCFAMQFHGPDRPLVWRRVLIAVALGVAGSVVGTGLGIALFCSTPSGGNLCGLGGVFGTGPFTAGLCMSGYAILTLRAGRNAP